MTAVTEDTEFSPSRGNSYESATGNTSEADLPSVSESQSVSDSDSLDIDLSGKRIVLRALSSNFVIHKANSKTMAIQKIESDRTNSSSHEEGPGAIVKGSSKNIPSTKQVILLPDITNARVIVDSHPPKRAL